MILKKIKIRNYKKFDDETFYFKKGTNVIIGKNNAGKTTLLEILENFLKSNAKPFNLYFKEKIKQNPDVKEPFIEGTFENNGNEFTVKLDTSKKTFKIDFGENIVSSPIMIGAHSDINLVEKAINIEFTNGINNNEKIIHEIKSLSENIITKIKKSFTGTTIIKEKNDKYNFELHNSPEKIASINFSDEAYSIKNKGLGQQKEFLINYFAGKDNINYTKFVLIDEIENSLSNESLIGLMNKIKETKNIEQFFITTHRHETINKGINIHIENIGNAPANLVKGINKIIWVEGKNDVKEFKNIWINKLFMLSGGSTIVDIAQILHDEKDLNISSIKLL